MAKPPGMAVFGGDSQTLESAGGIAPGDAVALDGSGRVVKAKSGTGGASPYVGVAADSVDPDHKAGDMVSIYVAGTIITSVTSGVGAGKELAASSTAGALTTGDTGGVSFSAEGGSYKGPSVPAGYAAVCLGGVI